MSRLLGTVFFMGVIAVVKMAALSGGLVLSLPVLLSTLSQTNYLEMALWLVLAFALSDLIPAISRLLRARVKSRSERYVLTQDGHRKAVQIESVFISPGYEFRVKELMWLTVSIVVSFSTIIVLFLIDTHFIAKG